MKTNISSALPLSLLLTIAAVAEAPAFAQEAQKHLVRFSFKAGTVVHSVLEQDTKTTMTIGGAPRTTHMKAQIFSTTSIKSATGNTASIESHITRVKVLADNIAMKIDYDSAKEDSDPGLLEGLASMVGSKISTQLTDQGKITGLQMPDWADSLAPAGVDLEQMMSQSVVQLPEHPLAIGDSWEVELVMPMGQMGDGKATTTYKLIAIDKQSITLQETVVMDVDSLELPGGIEFEKVTGKGESKLDLRTGTPINRSMSMNMTMSGQMEMEVEMVVTQTLKPAPEQTSKAKHAAKPTTGKPLAKTGK